MYSDVMPDVLTHRRIFQLRGLPSRFPQVDKLHCSIKCQFTIEVYLTDEGLFACEEGVLRLLVLLIL